MEFTHFLTVKACIFVLELGGPSVWIPLADELSVSLLHDGIKGSYFFSKLGARILLDSKILQTTEFKRKSRVFGYWMDEATDTIYGIGFKTSADLIKFSETFSKIKLLLDSKKLREPDQQHEEVQSKILKETEKSQTTEIPKNATPQPVASTSFASYSTSGTPEKELNEQKRSNFPIGKTYFKLLPAVSSKYSMSIAKLTAQVRQLQHLSKHLIKTANEMISHVHGNKRKIAERQEKTLDWINLCEKCTQEITCKEEKIKFLQQKVEDEHCRRDYIEKLLNDEDEEVTALREAIGRSEQVDDEMETNLLLRLLQLHINMEAKTSVATEESAVSGLGNAVQPFSWSLKDMSSFYDEVESAIKDISYKSRTKCGSSPDTNESG